MFILIFEIICKKRIKKTRKSSVSSKEALNKKSWGKF